MRFTLPRLAAALALTCTLSALAAGSTQGQVLEVRDADPYTYLRLKTEQGETWAAIEKAPLKVGQRVTLYQPMVMRNFESKALKKTFDQIVFASLTDPEKSAAGAPAGNPHSAMGAKAPQVAKLAKAPGANGRSVAEVYAGKAKLKDKPVTLHVQVVKASFGILGKNWFHVQDGSGTAGTDDLLVTSTDKAAVGDVLTVQGTVRTDVKVGSGYDYAVMVENASLRK